MIKAGLKERVKSDKERGVTVRVYGWCFTPSPPIRLTQVAHGERKQEAATTGATGGKPQCCPKLDDRGPARKEHIDDNNCSWWERKQERRG